MEGELEIIDTQQFIDMDIYTPRGSKLVKGYGEGVMCRVLIARLPSCPRFFYDEDWLKRQPHKFQDLIPRENFIWYNILGWHYARK